MVCHFTRSCTPNKTSGNPCKLRCEWVTVKNTQSSHIKRVPFKNAFFIQAGILCQVKPAGQPLNILLSLPLCLTLSLSRSISLCVSPSLALYLSVCLSPSLFPCIFPFPPLSLSLPLSFSPSLLSLYTALTVSLCYHWTGDCTVKLPRHQLGGHK